jgi:hypothetical protein
MEVKRFSEILKLKTPLKQEEAENTSKINRPSTPPQKKSGGS